jgi:hypothetical protein
MMTAAAAPMPYAVHAATDIATVQPACGVSPPHRLVVPDDDTCIEASIAAGILSRTQNIAADRRRLLNDALIAATALKNGLVVLTANVADFDLLSQLQPATQILYYVPA